MSTINEPYYINNRLMEMTKGYNSQISGEAPVYTSDMLEYIGHFYDYSHSAMKYKDDTKENKRYGAASSYDCRFYLDQAKMYYTATKKAPFEVKMLEAYYCMLNLAKSYISFKSDYVDDFVADFSRHGIKEDHEGDGKDFSTIKVQYDKIHFRNKNGQRVPVDKYGGVFPMFAGMLDPDFQSKWSSETGKSLKTLLYNLPFVQSSYMNTYGSSKNRIDELFIPLAKKSAPYYYKATKTSLKLRAEIDEGYYSAEGGRFKDEMLSTFGEDLEFSAEGYFDSVNTAKKYSNNSISTDIKDLNTTLRRNFVYNGGNHPVWFIKRTRLNNEDVLNISTITINMAIMHRLSEIARYKPEQLQRLMESKENWLLHEYMQAALDQFIDEMASEITGHEVKFSQW